ncbi:hypothetical protein ACHAQH_010100 [Verticillium albo-atrum]
MARQNKLGIILPLFLALWSSLACGLQIVYRADSRPPHEIEAAGGFVPRGGTGIQRVAPNTSLYNHVIGAENGFSRMNDGYVSTTSQIDVAMGWIRNHFNGNGYVYAIAAGMNFIDVRETLRQHNPHPEEWELAAMGGVMMRQIRGVRTIRNNQVITEQDNTQYNTSYDNLRGSGSQPQLAGFPANHIAWQQNPWQQFGHCVNSGAAKRTEGTTEESIEPQRGATICAAKVPAKQAAEEYFKAQCGRAAC